MFVFWVRWFDWVFSVCLVQIIRFRSRYVSSFQQRIGEMENRREQWEVAMKKQFRNWAPIWDVYPFRSILSKEEFRALTSVCVFELPEETRARKLFDLFGCIGKVIEVSIVPRRNKGGKHFGFLRFKCAEDSRMLAVRVDNIQVMGTKIHVNLPIFERNQSGVQGRNKG